MYPHSQPEDMKTRLNTKTGSKKSMKIKLFFDGFRSIHFLSGTSICRVQCI